MDSRQTVAEGEPPGKHEGPPSGTHYTSCVLPGRRVVRADLSCSLQPFGVRAGELLVCGFLPAGLENTGMEKGREVEVEKGIRQDKESTGEINAGPNSP